MENTGNKKHYHIWVDGSALNCGQYMGAGWVIKDDKTKVAKSGHNAINKPQSGNSIIAEAKAAEMALLEVPSESVVTLHTDCKMVMDILDNKKQIKKKSNNSSKSRKKTIDALTSLFNTIEEQKVDVRPVKTTDKDPNLLLAHKLAQTGAEKAKSNRDPRSFTPPG
jgi:ribonuclease HI